MKDRKASSDLKNDAKRFENFENNPEQYHALPDEFDDSYIDCDWLCPDCAQMIKKEWKWFYS